MKAPYKIPAAGLVALLLLFGSITAANAQRGGHGGGGMRGGFGGGMRGGFSSSVHTGFSNNIRASVSFRSPAIHIGVGVRSTAFRGFYRPHYYSNVGLWLGTLPYGYYSFAWDNDPYYYYDGTFYEPGNDGYQVAVPPVGATVPELPQQAQQISIDGTAYYEYNGVYYLPVTGSDGKTAYQVAGKDGVLNTGTDAKTYNAAPQIGDMTDVLPEGAHPVKLDGKKYWVTPEGVYLEEVPNGDQTSYRIASLPDQDEQQ